MAKAASKKPKKPTKAAKIVPLWKRPLLWLRKWLLRGSFVLVAIVLLWISAYTVIAPPTTAYIISESRRLGGVDRTWVPIDEVAAVMPRSVVAAEDANFCQHWGFDMGAIRDAIEEGSNRGASTLTQQVVKNAFLWHGRSWIRKGMEALLTPVVEMIWTKRRIVEVYLNIAEFDEGVFGVDAAAHHYFGVSPSNLTATQAARLAAILPNPKGRSAKNPSNFVRKRSSSIRDGAATIDLDGRAACFQS
ncbi:monofunctional biosynthetic peptidoglycan transglycosylase [Algirhabdus cladophorae]|uniref:monofunctional biosynthetic peptidoglycan transglycosylase n=1 Tax=Algirhabdus cladophorae TaxID=3377108 RepID=UPI003B84A885